METKVVKLKHEYNLTSGMLMQKKMRMTPLKEWLIESDLKDRLSGTLKKNATIGFKSVSQLNEEALAQTLGWGFESLPTTFVTFNEAITEGDCHSLTEVGWHIDRLLNVHIFEEDIFELKYIVIHDTDGNIQRQGVGVVLKETSVSWIMKSHLVFALLTEYDNKQKEWSDCLNPF